MKRIATFAVTLALLAILATPADARGHHHGGHGKISEGRRNTELAIGTALGVLDIATRLVAPQPTVVYQQPAQTVVYQQPVAPAPVVYTAPMYRQPVIYTAPAPPPPPRPNYYHPTPPPRPNHHFHSRPALPPRQHARPHHSPHRGSQGHHGRPRR